MSEFKPSTWAQPATDIAKEYEAHDAAETHIEQQTSPEEISKSMVRRGIIDPNTGMCTGNSKASKVSQDNVRGFSKRGKENYERIFGHT